VTARSTSLVALLLSIATVVALTGCVGDRTAVADGCDHLVRSALEQRDSEGAVCDSLAGWVGAWDNQAAAPPAGPLVGLAGYCGIRPGGAVSTPSVPDRSEIDICQQFVECVERHGGVFGCESSIRGEAVQPY